MSHHRLAAERIEHVVVLMLENRSFDHMFAFAELPGVPALDPESHRNHLEPSDPESRSWVPSPDATYELPIDPPHSHHSVLTQLARRQGMDQMDGFVAAYHEKATGNERVPKVHWLNAQIALLVVCIGWVLLTQWIGPDWLRAAAATLLLWLVGALLAYRLRFLLRRKRIVGVAVLAAGILLPLIARIAGPRLDTGVWSGITLAAAGTVGLLWLKSKPMYVKSSTAAQALEDAGKVMRCMPKDKIPVLRTLASEFALATQWFSSVPGATWPNRQFAHAGTSEGTADIHLGFFSSKTIFELLDDGLPDTGRAHWHVYFDDLPQVVAYPKLWEDSRRRNWRHISDFEEDVVRGLPAYSFIEPRHTGKFSNSQHPNNNRDPVDGIYDFQRGEALIASIYETLRRHPETFAKTLFLVTYDEHGGLFDHESPPKRVRAPSRTKGAVGWTHHLAALFVTYRDSRVDFRRLGPRVPVVFVSPWIETGRRDATPYDHSSIVKSLSELFVSTSPWLTRRDRFANSFLHLVEGTTEMRQELPDLSRYLHPAPITLGLVAPPVEAAPAPVPGGPLDMDMTQQLKELGVRVEERLDELGAPLAPIIETEFRLLPQLEEAEPQAILLSRFRRYLNE